MATQVTLTAYNMGLGTTEAEFDRWVAFVSAVSGFEVDSFPFSDGRACDEITSDSDDERESAAELLSDLWNRWCGGDTIAEHCKSAGDATAAMTRAEDFADADQDWKEGSTSWAFGDGSRLVVSGSDVTATR